MRLRGPIDLPGSLRGGQAFRWRTEADGAFVGAIGGSAWRLARAPDGGVDARAWPARTADEQALARYFRLEADDDARRARLARDAALAPAMRAHPGLRLLRQDPWETTVAFITSANNNVLRIEGILARIAEKWGAPIDAPFAARSFPAAETIGRARESSLRAVGLGYRAPFVREAARMVARGNVPLDALRGRPLVEMREALLELPGVGPKVADCIALFSLDADDAFPIDRWIARAVSDVFFAGRALKPREVEAFARERWGMDAGLAQQYLFHAARMAGRRVGAAPPP